MEYMKIMKRNNLLLLVLGAVFSFSAQAGTLSRNLTDQEFSVVVPSQENASPDRSKVYRDALNGLAEKLSGGVYDTVNLNGRSIDYYIDNIGFQNRDLVLNFDRIKVLQLLRSQNIPLYLEARPDVMVWMSIYDEKYNISDIMSESNTNSFTASLMQTASSYGLKFYLPIMDSDDALYISDQAIQNFDVNSLSAANGRYATRYYIAGTIQGYNTDHGDLVWKIYEAGSGAPVYQSVAHGVPHDLGRIVAKDVVKFFAKQHPEYISDEDVPPVAESSGFSHESNKALNPDEATIENNGADNGEKHAAGGSSGGSYNRLDLFGGVVNSNRVRVVIANVVKFQDVIFVEKSLKNIAGINKVMLSQSQADQLVYELTINKDFNGISQKIADIPGLYIPDPSKPFNYLFDVQRKNTPAVETANADHSGEQSVTTETVGKEKKSEKVPGDSGNAAKPAETPKQDSAPAADNRSGEPAVPKKEQNDGGYEEMEAIPITDPDSIKDTSNRKL